MSLDISLRDVKGANIFHKNITHNITPMWKEAGVYSALYESQGKNAKEVIPTLENGLSLMKDNPKRFSQLDAPNGWGKYKHAVPWLTELIDGFKKHSDGVIEIS
ncbi:hypothetical protein MZM54_00975 [[Brevibacterium] frigoritolerans]|nr:hypothetical protein [Peribacillus frigoritolerans]